MNKYLLDENLSNRIAEVLSPHLGVVAHVREQPLVAFSDIEIWNFASDKNYAIITKDSDFLHYGNLKAVLPK